jgi:hypothetical protein
MQEITHEPLTAPLPNAGGQQSICKSGRFAGTIIFALQMATNIVSLSVIFRQENVSNRTRQSSKTL